MKSKSTLSVIAFSLALILLGFAFVNLRGPDNFLREEVETPAKEYVGERPTLLEIPSLNIKANVQLTGLTKSGNMGVPTNFHDVAWYKLGTIPGNVGSAVMDGHLDNAIALPGVFKDLAKIKGGDDIYVTLSGGDRIHFVVEEKEVYPYTEAPLTKIFNRKDVARLNLITCGGDWIQSKKSYSERVVVYAVLAN